MRPNRSVQRTTVSLLRSRLVGAGYCCNRVGSSMAVAHKLPLERGRTLSVGIKAYP